MPGPAQPASSTVGALLRLIEQEKSKAPHLQTPQAAPSSPARDVAQAPLETPILPESPGSERTVGVKPESLPALSEAGISGDTVPGRSIVGAIGGVGEGTLPGVTPSFGTEPQTPQTPKVQPTLGEYRGQGKTAAEWYAETGKQSTLDAIGRDVNKSVNLETGEASIVGGPRSGKAVVDPEGNVNFQPEAPRAPNNASMQDYLSQGKTREQWYAETGQQSSLDKLGGPGNLKPLPTPQPTTPIIPTSTLSQNLMPSSIQAPTSSGPYQGEITPNLAQEAELKAVQERLVQAQAEFDQTMERLKKDREEFNRFTAETENLKSELYWDKEAKTFKRK